MRRLAPLSLSEAQRAQLERWSRGGATPYRLVIRSRIVLLAARGRTNREIARHLKTNPITVARWRSRFALLGLEGIRTDAPRSGSPPPVPAEVVRRVLSLTLHGKPPDRARWSTRRLAREVGVSHSTVRRIWKAHGIRPGRSRLSQIPRYARPGTRPAELVGVYVAPPRRAVALAIPDAGWALSPRAPAPGSPRAGGPWMAELASSLNSLEIPWPPRTLHRHHEQEFLSFLRSVQARRLGSERIVLLAEASRPELSPQLQHWLSRHPRVATEICDGPEAWQARVLASIRETAPAPGPPGLTSFLSAVARWKRDGAPRSGGFAWTKE